MVEVPFDRGQLCCHWTAQAWKWRSKRSLCQMDAVQTSMTLSIGIISNKQTITGGEDDFVCVLSIYAKKGNISLHRVQSSGCLFLH